MAKPRNPATLPIPDTPLPDPFGDLKPVTVDIRDGGAPVTLVPPVYTFGRPTNYTPELAARLVEAVRLGQTPIELCETEDWAPSVAVFYRWRDSYPDFREAIQRARLAGAEVMADRGLAFVDKADPDNKIAILKASRQAEYRFRMASVYDRRFSDRQIVTHEHTEPGQSLDMAGQDIATLAAQLGKLLAKAQAVDVDSKPVDQGQVSDKTKE